MKKSIKRIFACILCVICLASSFLVFTLDAAAATDVPLGASPAASVSPLNDYSCGIFYGATASFTFYNIRRDDGSLVLEQYSDNFAMAPGDILFTDYYYFTVRNKVTLQGFGDWCYQYYESGIGFETGTVEVTLGNPVGMGYVHLYFPDFKLVPAGDGAGVVRNLLYKVKSPGGVVSYVDSVDNGFMSNYYRDYTFLGFKFTVQPVIIQYPRSAQMRDLARYFTNSYEGGGFGEEHYTFQFWADDGTSKYLIPNVEQQIDNARGEGYNKGYDAGFGNGYSEGYDEGYNVGGEESFNNGYILGYEESAIDNQPVWYQSGYDAGERDGKNTGFSNGYDVGYGEGRQTGYSEGFQAGHTTDLDLSMGGLFTEIIGAPVKVVLSMLHFDFLGVNLSATFRGLITLAILIALTTVVIKVFL